MPTESLITLSWKPGEIENALRAVRQHVEREAQRHIDWYARKRRWKARWSSALRLTAILLGALGGLAPLVNLAKPGYLAFGGALACIAFDHYFGISTAWMRYTAAGLAIEKSLDEFRLEWAGQTAQLQGADPAPQQLQRLIGACRQLTTEVRGHVDLETSAWIAEFQSSLAQLDAELKASRPSASRAGLQ